MSAPSSPMTQAATVGQNNLAEVLTGVAVVIGIILLLLFIYAGGGAGAGSGYEVLARVPNVAGLGVGTDVRLSGIKIGNVSDMTLDPNNFLVTIHMNIRKDIQIPADSSLQVTSSGVLGGQYISITPGGDAKNIPAGGRIVNAQGSVDLMGTVARFLGNDNGQQTQSQTPEAKSAPAPSAPQQSTPPAP